ncbi:MAG: right-handed parallel beta-helix repeat-containing protein [Sedimentisphaerales bacterium]|nr:right-handed parallel beta-helix repeat-containing protein [Sedimentisphaerales bacterium]
MKTLVVNLAVLAATVLGGGALSRANDGAAQATAGRTYYVATGGDDTNSGLSPAAAWKAIERVNQQEFEPGDAILFRSGDEWNGQLQPQGSGATGNPIRLDRFGEGPMPVIDLGAATGAAVKLINQQWWIIQNLEVTSGVPPEPGVGRQGIVIAAEGEGGHTAHMIVRNCYIHDLWGQLGGRGTFTGYNSAAIFVGPTQGGGRRTGGAGADDITIENNRIERVDRCGIIVWRGHENIVVRGNTMENLGGDGIFMNGCRAGLMERNVVRRSCLRTGDPGLVIEGRYNPHSAAMWIQDCTDTVIQFNEAYDTGRQKGNGDGNAYDFDFNCRNCVVQYNYSRNNHGFLLIMNRTQGNVARYNISQNDQTHLVQMHGVLADDNVICNNVFYVDYGTADIDLYMGGTEVSDENKSRLGACFVNNIFYAIGQGRFRTVYTYGSALERQYLDQVQLSPPPPIIRHNWYFGPWTNGLPHDPEAKVGDPMFVAPGSGGVGLASLQGYRLRAESPCIGTGAVIPKRGTRDFFGNALHDNAASFGACDPSQP